MIDLAIELGRIGEFDALAIDHRAHKSLLSCRLEHFAEFALSAPHERREDLNAGPVGPVEHGIGDLACALALHRASAVGAMRCTGPGVEQAQVIVHFRDCPDGRTRVMAGSLLLDRNGR